jgi:hypothetical protein
MSQKSAKSAAELESMIMAELREHPECESAGVSGKANGRCLGCRPNPRGPTSQ